MSDQIIEILDSSDDTNDDFFLFDLDAENTPRDLNSENPKHQDKLENTTPITNQTSDSLGPSFSDKDFDLLFTSNPDLFAHLIFNDAEDDSIVRIQDDLSQTKPHSSSSSSSSSNSMVHIFEPNPDIHQLFFYFNFKHFDGRLDSVVVKWSNRMTL
eukprot:TRINITY_DN2073_c0_g1_i1.p1 TRINITY_DN2073_c0_g1~~TRINITY_DN2073_c0_g1_i1.p1  ORF type:complete len:164 (-),score=49.37 TRINITY_DN2073_c0_g1_i1:110-577(-)